MRGRQMVWQKAARASATRTINARDRNIKVPPFGRKKADDFLRTVRSQKSSACISVLGFPRENFVPGGYCITAEEMYQSSFWVPVTLPLFFWGQVSTAEVLDTDNP